MIPSLRSTPILIALAAALAGCGDPVQPRADDISVAPTADGLEIVNTTDEPIYAMVMDSGTLALVDFSLCARLCPVQLPSERRTVPWTSILGYSAERNEYLILWSHGAVAADGTTELGPMHTLRVTR